MSARLTPVSLGDIAEQHPELFETLAIAGVMLIIPESWFLRPLFMVFGMSPEGPVEGAFFLGRLFVHVSYIHTSVSCMRPLPATYFWCRHSFASAFSLLVVYAAIFLLCIHTRATNIYFPGSFVAWAQGRFYGAYIPEGSWFSQLQRAGMTVGRRAHLVKRVITGVVIAVIAVAILFLLWTVPCFCF